MRIRKNYKVLSIEKHSVTLSDGTAFEGQPITAQCGLYGIEGVQVGDTVSADENPLSPTVVSNPFIEVGRAAAALKPAPFVAPHVSPYDPNAVGEEQIFRTERGQPLSPDDIDEMLRDSAKLVRDLTARVALLEIFSQTHCDHCKAILASGAFDKR